MKYIIELISSARDFVVTLRILIVVKNECMKVLLCITMLRIIYERLKNSIKSIWIKIIR